MHIEVRAGWCTRGILCIARELDASVLVHREISESKAPSAWVAWHKERGSDHAGSIDKCGLKHKCVYDARGASTHVHVPC